MTTADGRSTVTMAEKSELPLARFFFLMVGIGYLFPYSALTQPVDYWGVLLPDYNAEFAIAALYMVVNFFMLAGIVLAGSTKPNFDLRMYGGFVGQFIALMIVPISYYWGLTEFGNYFVVLSCTLFAAFTTSFIDSCMFALAGQYPDHYGFVEALQVGIGLSVLIGSVYRILTKLIAGDDDAAIISSSLVYFYTGAATVLLCVYCYWGLNALETTRRMQEAKREALITNIGRSNSSGGSGGRLYGTVARNEEEEEEVEDLLGPAGSSDTASTGSRTVIEGLCVGFERRNAAFKEVWWNEMMVTISYGTTFMVFPGLISIIPSYYFTDLNDNDWWELILLFIFSLSDVVGRNATHLRYDISADNVHLAVFARALIFIPAITLCVTGVFANDIISVLVVTLVGFTNGWIGTLTILLVNEKVSVANRVMVGSLTSLSLNAGISSGAIIAVFLNSIFS